MVRRILFLTGATLVVILGGAYAVSRMDVLAAARVKSGGDTLVFVMRRCDSQILVTVREGGWLGGGGAETLAWFQGDRHGEAAAIEVDERGGQARFRMGGEEIVYSLHERRFLEEARQFEKSGN